MPSALVPPGTCLLSYDGQRNSSTLDSLLGIGQRQAYLMLSGDTVPWSSGIVDASAAIKPGASLSPPASPPAVPDILPSPIDPTVTSPDLLPPSSPSPEPTGNDAPLDSPALPDGSCPPPGKMCGGLCIDVTQDEMK